MWVVNGYDPFNKSRCFLRRYCYGLKTIHEARGAKARWFSRVAWPSPSMRQSARIVKLEINRSVPVFTVFTRGFQIVKLEINRSVRSQ